MTVKTSFRLGLFTLFFLVAPVSAEEWTSNIREGYVEHIIRNGQANEFNISCDVRSPQLEGKNTTISMKISGKAAPADSEVYVLLDGDKFQISVDESGHAYLDCSACYSNYRAMWEKMLTAHTMSVQFEDGRKARFDMMGAKRALGSAVCKTKWDRNDSPD